MNNQNINDIKEEFQRNGFVTIPGFFDPQELHDLQKAVHHMLEDVKVTNPRVFTFAKIDCNITDKERSVNSIRYFFEKEAVNEKGELIVDRHCLSVKHQSLNKMGHSMHCLEPIFQKITFQRKVQNLVQNMGFVKPRVVQSIYIFKNPRIGGVVLPHQEATYLSVIPKKAGDRPKVLGVWLPLEDVTEENGCLSFIPGSHKTGLHRQRIPSESGKYVYDKPLPHYDDNTFVSVPAKKGSVILIDGLVVHKSAHNYSKYARPIYTFHLYDADSCDWDPLNWLQEAPDNPFPPLFTE